MFDDERDQRLVARCAEGDTAAFEALYAAYAPILYNFLFRLCYDPALAEDCLQEVFLRAWRAAPRWRGEGRVSTYLFQIAKNAALDTRARLARERIGLGLDGRTPDEPGRAAADEPATDDPGPPGRLEGEELRALVRRAVEALPEEQRLVVQLAQTEGLTFREVAEILQLPVGTVKSRMAAAAETLRRRLARHVRA